MTEAFRFSVLALLLVNFAAVGYTYRELREDIAETSVEVARARQQTDRLEHNLGNQLDNGVECAHFTVRRP